MRWLLRPARIVGGLVGPDESWFGLEREGWLGWLPRVIVVTAPVVVVFDGCWLNMCRVVGRSFRTPAVFVVIARFEVLAFER